MPDWKQLVRERMQPKPSTQADEVIDELSTHLEETYNSLLDDGCAPDAAFERTLQEVDDWNVLFKRICRTRLRRNPMNDRVRRLWLLASVTWLAASLSVIALQRPDQPLPYLISFYSPWLASLPLACAAAAYFSQPENDRVKRLWLSVMVTWLGAILSLMVLDRIDRPELVLKRPIPVMFSLPWLATLILVGAAGAYFAQRADASRKTRLLVATSPALLLGILMLLLLPWTLAVNGYRWGLTFFAIDAENGAIVPALALLLGALPFLWKQSPDSVSVFDGTGRTLAADDSSAGAKHA